MTDNELLWSAAKAAEIDFSIKGQVPTRFDGKDFIVWNPLSNDGDALRLAVKLKLCVINFSDFVRVDAVDLPDVYEGHNTDPYAATRRAIVRLAAAIGEAL